jgi:hypothetical protein
VALSNAPILAVLGEFIAANQGLAIGRKGGNLRHSGCQPRERAAATIRHRSPSIGSKRLNLTVYLTVFSSYRLKTR